MAENLKPHNEQEEQEQTTTTQWDILSQDTEAAPSTDVAETEQTAPIEAQEAEKPLELNLDDAEWDDKFAQAETFVKKGKVTAVQLTEEGLKSGAYADRDIRWDEESQSYVVDTYVMHNETNPDGTTSRVAVLENTRTVEPGFWLLTNPLQQEGDRPNNYAQEDETFQKNYEPDERSTEPGVYRAKGTAKIFRNPTGKPVFIHKWGGIQEGDKFCYFCERHTDGKTSRYLLSENDFAAYEPYEAPAEDSEQ